MTETAITSNVDDVADAGVRGHQLLRTEQRAVGNGVIVLCGSGKHRSDIFGTARELERLGYVVLCPPLHKIDELLAGRPEEARLLAWKGATWAHFKRIDKADVVLVVNPSGYVGTSTTLELGYAAATNKLIIAAREDQVEPARNVLFDKVLTVSDAAAIAQECHRYLSGSAP